MSPSTAIIRRMDSLGKWTVAGVLVAIAFGVAAIVTPELRQFLHLEKKPGEASIPDTPEGATTIPAQAVQLSDLPQDLLNPVQTDSAAELTAQLKQRGSLTLNGSTLTLGSVGAGRTVTIACRTLRLTNGARIITNGNHLVLVALHTRFRSEWQHAHIGLRRSWPNRDYRLPNTAFDERRANHHQRESPGSRSTEHALRR